jgi:hypothetical protein
VVVKKSFVSEWAHSGRMDDGKPCATWYSAVTEGVLVGRPPNDLILNCEDDMLTKQILFFYSTIASRVR